MPFMMNFWPPLGMGRTIAEALLKATLTFLMNSAAGRRGRPAATYSVKRAWYACQSAIWVISAVESSSKQHLILMRGIVSNR